MTTRNAEGFKIDLFKFERTNACGPFLKATRPMMLIFSQVMFRNNHICTANVRKTLTLERRDLPVATKVGGERVAARDNYLCHSQSTHVILHHTTVQLYKQVTQLLSPLVNLASYPASTQPLVLQARRALACWKQAHLISCSCSCVCRVLRFQICNTYM